MLVTVWILFIVFGYFSFDLIILRQIFGGGLTWLGYLILFPTIFVTAICAGILFGGLHIPILGV